ncbi:hypothetical protein KCU78_g392, partial [Aureobasidium melanogenum]
MRLRFRPDFLSITLLALFATGTIVFATTETSSAPSQDNNEYLAPLYNDCRDDDPKCGIKAGAYMVALHGFYRISSHLAFLERTLKRDPTVNWQANWDDDAKSAFYTVKNVTKDELEAIRKDPGVCEVEQSYWIEVDDGWDLECRIPGLSEERKRLFYEEIDIPQCEKSWLSEEEKEECSKRNLLPFCEMEGWELNEKERRYCFENRELLDGQGVSALTSAVLAPASSETAMSIDDNTYLVPLYESCPVGSSTCGTIDGTYLVMLRKGYNPSSHLSFITENLHIDPVKEWQLKWFNEQDYIASDVSMDLLNLLRQDSGIEGIEEGSWFEMVEVDRCQNSAFSEDEAKQCYDAGPFDACRNEVLSEDEMWICVHKTMQFRIKFAIIVVAIFAISHHCLASTSKAKALSGDDVDYLAPLINDCRDDDPRCEVQVDPFKD